MKNDPNSAFPIKNNWNEQKIKLKERFNILTDKDFFFVEGKKKQMMKKLQEKLGKSESELNEIIERL